MPGTRPSIDWPSTSWSPLQLGMVGRRGSGVPDLRTARRGRRRDRHRAAAPPRVRSAGSSTGPSRWTPDQDAATWDIRADITRPTPMLRLLQGDVGSGKTAVAAYQCSPRRGPGSQGAPSRPWTSSRQHHRTLTSLLEDASLPVELLTGSLTAASARRTLEPVASGMAPIVVGTHALLQERVSFAAPAGRHRRAAPVRREQREPARGRRPARSGAARSAHDRHADPAHARPGAVRRPRRLEPPDAAGGSGAHPHGNCRPEELAGTWQKVREEAAAGHRTFVVVPLIDEAEADASPGSRRTAGLLGCIRAAAEAEAVWLRRWRCSGSGWSTAG